MKDTLKETKLKSMSIFRVSKLCPKMSQRRFKLYGKLNSTISLLLLNVLKLRVSVTADSPILFPHKTKQKSAQSFE